MQEMGRAKGGLQRLADADLVGACRRLRHLPGQGTQQEGARASCRVLAMSIYKTSEKVGRKVRAEFGGGLLAEVSGADGSQSWLVQKGTDAADGVTKLQVMGKDVFLAGFTAGDMDGHLSDGQEDVVVMKFTGSGDWQWTTQSGSVGSDAVTSMQVDKSGVVYVAGDTLDARKHSGVGDIFLQKYAELWDSHAWSLWEMRHKAWQEGHPAKIPASHGLGDWSFAAAASHQVHAASSPLVFTTEARSMRLGNAFVKKGGLADLPAVSTGSSVLVADPIFPVGEAGETSVAVHPGCPGESEPFLVVKFVAHTPATVTGLLRPLGVARCGGIELWVYKNSNEEAHRPQRFKFLPVTGLAPPPLPPTSLALCS